MTQRLVNPIGAARREAGRYFAAQQFLTRVPCPPSTPFDPDDLAASIGWFPTVGVLVGSVVGGVAVALRNVVTPSFAAVVAVAVGAAVTGAFHEDGFADTCDAFGGYTVARRREIMRDSRIGTFGAVGLIALFAAKVSVLSSLLSFASGTKIVFASICAHTVSRCATVVAIRFIPPVNDPTSKTQSYRVSDPRLFFALAFPTVPIAVWLIGWNATFLGGTVVVLIESARPFFRRFSDGISGDGLGAINQLSEVVAWAVVLHTLSGG